MAQRRLDHRGRTSCRTSCPWASCSTPVPCGLRSGIRSSCRGEGGAHLRGAGARVRALSRAPRRSRRDCHSGLAWQLTVTVTQDLVLEATGQRDHALARFVLFEKLLAERVRAGERRGKAAGEHREAGAHCPGSAVLTCFLGEVKAGGCQINVALVVSIDQLSRRQRASTRTRRKPGTSTRVGKPLTWRCPRPLADRAQPESRARRRGVDKT